MKVLAYEVGQEPYFKEINGLHEMQEFVGGTIQGLKIGRETYLVCNDEGKLIPLKRNQYLLNFCGNILDEIYGNFFVCSQGEEDFTDISLVSQWEAKCLLYPVY